MELPEDEKALSISGCNVGRIEGNGLTVKAIDSLTSFMECPVCFDVSLPIFQCKNGHIVCSICWKGLAVKFCPTCRVSIADPNRNLALEKILKNCGVLLPCKFTSNGCQEKMCYNDKETHQGICPFKTFPCPMSTNHCKWEGRLNEVVNHLKCRSRPGHAVAVLYGESATFFFRTDPSNIDTESETSFEVSFAVQIQMCFENAFLIIFRATPSEGGDGHDYSALVQLVGKKDEAAQFAYRMELERDGRRLSWEARPLEMSDNVKLAMDKCDCLSFNYKTMKLFQNEDIEIISLDVTICKY